MNYKVKNLAGTKTKRTGQELLNEVEDECLKMGYVVTNTGFYLIVKSEESPHTVDISICRDSELLCADSDNDSEYSVHYTRHRKLKNIIKKIREKFNES